MYHKLFKRIFDLVISFILFPLLLLIILIIGLTIKFTDGGAIFYAGNRIGKNSKVFKMYKFRSMKENSTVLLNEDGSTFNSKSDNRLTKIGKFLRESSIDEVPQILNVIKGDMSLVGPRASMDISLGTFKNDEIDKMKVRPGITGYTQAFYRNSVNNRDKRLKDAWYANNVTFFLDVKIIIKTVFTVLNSSNIYTDEENKNNA